MFAGAPLLLLTTTGARSGQPRVAPLAYTTDNGRLVVIASKGGAPTHPDWFHNLRANPEVTVEVGTETFPARATITEGRSGSVSSTRWRRRCRTSRSTSATRRASSRSSCSSAPARPSWTMQLGKTVPRGRSSPAKPARPVSPRATRLCCRPGGCSDDRLHRIARRDRAPAPGRFLRRLAASALAGDASPVALRQRSCRARDRRGDAIRSSDL